MLAPVTYSSAYYVESKLPDPIGKIAIRPTITEEDHLIQWEDTVRGTSHRYTDLKLEFSKQEQSDTPEVIEITTAKGTLKLKKLSLDLFNRILKNKLPGGLSFNSNQELQNYYLETDFQSLDS